MEKATFGMVKSIRGAVNSGFSKQGCVHHSRERDWAERMEI